MIVSNILSKVNARLMFMYNHSSSLSSRARKKNLRSVLILCHFEVIFAESPEELQTALDTMQLYCDTWKVQVNTSKTKIVVFQKEK